MMVSKKSARFKAGKWLRHDGSRERDVDRSSVSDDRHATSETVMDKIKFYVGLDVHEDSFAIAFAAALFTGRSSLRRHDPL